MEPAGTRFGSFAQRSFSLARCGQCGFAAVVDPWLDYEAIYNDAYYRGRGADPHVDYISALEDPARATQRYEWEGILRRIQSLTTYRKDTHWLDYGCGVGGLVNFLREKGYTEVYGFEQGWSLERLRERSVPHVEEGDLICRAGSFEIVTAIEVLEHTIDPVAELRRMRSLMKPGGLLFLTTGNAEPYRNKLGKWQYVIPEVHVSFFEPRTLARAMGQAGFRPEQPGYGPGWKDLYRAKVLRTVGIRRANLVEKCLPWSIAGRLLESKLELARQPVGIAVAEVA